VTALLPNAAAPDLDAEIARASEDKRPLLVLVTELGKSGADDDAHAILESSHLKNKTQSVGYVLLDLNVSRNRATAARFHVIDTPLLVCLSPKGVIVSRDEKSLTKDLVLKRIEELGPKAVELDAKLATLRETVVNNSSDFKAQLALADFLRERQNLREAIPHLAAVAHAETAETALRIRAWVDLASAHLWVAEGEKCRHEAEDLIAVLGAKNPEAQAGGKLCLALQDLRGKRTALARQGFLAAIAAAPGSDYAKEASEELARLPKEGQ
jgi:hypothetical protein